MSRSLTRIRNLVSEIEEIHRQGQQGGMAAFARSTQHKAESHPIPAPIPAPAPVAPVETYIPEPSPVLERAPDPVDPFEELNKVVHLDEHRDIFAEEMPREAKIFMQLSGAVALSLQIEDTGEMVELRQVGEMLEIRFSDGKAFHIPLKAVA